MPSKSAEASIVQSKILQPLAVGLALWLVLAISAWAQSPTIPNFWNPGEQMAKPDLGNLQRLRFLTTTDFPPFNFIDRRKRLTGFHIDLARAICAELGIVPKCQIQALPWDEIEVAMERGDGDAILAGLDINAKNRAKYEFSRPYLHIPGRFVSRKEGGASRSPETMIAQGKTTAVIANSGHDKWLGTAFPQAKVSRHSDREAALVALQTGKADMVFADAVSLSFWLVSEQASNCCTLVGGPYMSLEHFGRGMAVAFPKGRSELAAATDYALRELNDKGTFAELYLRYFPVGLY